LVRDHNLNLRRFFISPRLAHHHSFAPALLLHSIVIILDTLIAHSRTFRCAMSLLEQERMTPRGQL
jgi:hypothetical protein